MRKFSAAAILGIVSLIVAGGVVLKAAESRKPVVKWETDLHKAHEKAVETNKPMLLVFGAEWCHYCKKLEQTTLTNAELAKYINTNFIPVHIDADEQEKVAEILEVKGLPCSIVLSPDADLLGRITGFKQPSAFYEELAKARKLHTPAVQTASKTRHEEPAAR
jgi:thioredoxin-related protein